MDNKLRQAQEHYERGNALDEAGDTAPAIQEWQAAIQLNPNHFEAHYNLGIAYADAVDLTRAVDEMETARGIEPEDADAQRELIEILFERANAFIAQKDAERARADWERVVELDSNNAAAHLKLGQLFADKYADGDAEEHLRAAIASNMFLTDAYDKLAEILLAENRKGEAISLLRQALNTFHRAPDHLSPMGYLGRAGLEIQSLPLDTSVSDLARDLADLELEAGDPDRAMAALEQAEPEKEDAAIWRDLAQAFEARGDAESSALAQNRAAALERGEIEESDDDETENLDPVARAALADQHFGEGEKFYERDEYDKAFEEYSEAVRLNPDHADAHYSLGLIYQDDEEYDLAAKEFREALRIDPQDEQARGQLEQVTRAEAETRASQPDPTHPARPSRADTQGQAADQHFDEGEKFYARGEYEKAFEQYSEAVRSNPDHADAHFSLGLIYEEDEDYALAEKEFREVLRIDPKDEQAHAHLGQVTRAAAEARASQHEPAHHARPSHEDTQGQAAEQAFDQGEIEYARNRFDQARAEYQNAIRLNPNHGDAHYSLGLIYQRDKQWEGAAKEFREALRIDPRSADAHCRLGEVFDARQDWQSALSEYRAAIECDPELAEAQAGLIWDLLEMNELTEAHKELLHAKLEPHAAADLWEEMGKMHAERGERGGAIAAFRRALELNKNLMDARDGLKRLGG